MAKNFIFIVPLILLGCMVGLLLGIPTARMVYAFYLSNIYDNSGSTAYVVTEDSPLHTVSVRDSLRYYATEFRVVNGQLQMWQRVRGVSQTDDAATIQWVLYEYPQNMRACPQDCAFYIRNNLSRFLVFKEFTETAVYRLMLPESWQVTDQSYPDFIR